MSESNSFYDSDEIWLVRFYCVITVAHIVLCVMQNISYSVTSIFCCVILAIELRRPSQYIRDFYFPHHVQACRLIFERINLVWNVIDNLHHVQTTHYNNNSKLNDVGEFVLANIRISRLHSVAHKYFSFFIIARKGRGRVKERTNMQCVDIINFKMIQIIIFNFCNAWYDPCKLPAHLSHES